MGKGSCDGRLFEATEIATMDDEMLMERVAEVGQGREAQSRTQWRDGKG